MANAQVLVGDCREHMRTWDHGAVDAIVTDPPYDLTTHKRYGPGQKPTKGPPQFKRLTGGFMGLSWDATGIAFDPKTWALAYALLKPGAHLLAFGGSRTSHRMACAIEDAGFEIRDSLAWLYGSGFPKSLNLEGDHAGWGTALKPAWELIVMARKPLVGTVLANVMQHGTGALNIEGCRIETTGRPRREGDYDPSKNGVVYAGGQNPGSGFDGGSRAAGTTDDGRWPANVVVEDETLPFAKYFYCPKASRAEREAGLEQLETTTRNRVNPGGIEHDPKWAPVQVKNNHPTVKPIALMRWLCRLVTPSGGLIYDPFCGSGSTGVAARLESFRFIGSELDAHYGRLAQWRIAAAFGPLFAEAP